MKVKAEESSEKVDVEKEEKDDKTKTEEKADEIKTKVGSTRDVRNELLIVL